MIDAILARATCFVSACCVQAIQLLAMHGAEVGARNKFRKTAEQLCTDQKCLQTMAKLREEGDLYRQELRDNLKELRKAEAQARGIPTRSETMCDLAHTLLSDSAAHVSSSSPNSSLAMSLGQMRLNIPGQNDCTSSSARSLAALTEAQQF